MVFVTYVRLQKMVNPWYMSHMTIACDHPQKQNDNRFLQKTEMADATNADHHLVSMSCKGFWDQGCLFID